MRCKQKKMWEASRQTHADARTPFQNNKTNLVSGWYQSETHSIEEWDIRISEPLMPHAGLFTVNICLIKPSVSFVCYFEFDICNQNWSVCYREAAKSDMTNAGQAVQVLSQSGRRDWSSLESIMIKLYWHRASIKISFDSRENRKMAAYHKWKKKSLSKRLYFTSALQSIYKAPQKRWRTCSSAIDFPLIRFFFLFFTIRPVLRAELMWVMMVRPHLC